MRKEAEIQAIWCAGEEESEEPSEGYTGSEVKARGEIGSSTNPDVRYGVEEEQYQFLDIMGGIDMK